MDVAVGDEPQQKTFQARETMRTSDRQQLQSLHTSLPSLCLPADPSQRSPLLNGKPLQDVAPAEEEDVSRRREGGDSGHGDVTMASSPPPPPPPPPPPLLLSSDKTDGIINGETEREASLQAEVHPEEMDLELSDAFCLSPYGSSALSTRSPSPSPSFSDAAESDQDLPPGTLWLSEDEGGEEEEQEREAESGGIEKDEDGTDGCYPEKRPRMDGERDEVVEKTNTLEAQLRIQKAVQQLVREQLPVLQLVVANRSLQELRDRVGRMECSHQRELQSHQEKMACLSILCAAAGEAAEKADRQATEKADRQATEKADRQATEKADGQATEKADGQATEKADRQATENADGQATENAGKQPEQARSETPPPALSCPTPPSTPAGHSPPHLPPELSPPYPLTSTPSTGLTLSAVSNSLAPPIIGPREINLPTQSSASLAPALHSSPAPTPASIPALAALPTAVSFRPILLHLPDGSAILSSLTGLGAMTYILTGMPPPSSNSPSSVSSAPPPAPTATAPPNAPPNCGVPPSPGSPVAPTQPIASSQPTIPTTPTAKPPTSPDPLPASRPAPVQSEVSGMPVPSPATSTQPSGRPAARVPAPGPSQTGSAAAQTCVRPVFHVPVPTSIQANQVTQPSVTSIASMPTPAVASKTGGHVTRRPADSTVSKTTPHVSGSGSRAGAFIDLTKEDDDDDDVIVMVSSSPMQKSSVGAMNKVPGCSLQSSASKRPASTTTTTTVAPVLSCNPAPRPPGPSPLLATLRPVSSLTTGALGSLPPKPRLRLEQLRDHDGIVLSWSVEEAERSGSAVDCYQLYAYHQDTSVSARPASPAPDPSASSKWRRIGELKAQQLPMTCTLLQFPPGSRYYFVVRARNALGRYGPFSEPQCSDTIRPNSGS